MADIQMYSLTDFEVNIQCDAMNIEIEPTANLVGRIGWARTHEAFTLNGDANGGNYYQRDINKAGEITLEINQLSDYIPILKDYQNGAENSPRKYMATITIKGNEDGTNVTGTMCLLQKHPDNTRSETAENLTFTFLTPFLDIQ